MKSIAEYEAMNTAERENFLAHASADLIHKMYYENNGKGLDVFIKNMTAIVKRARDCLECLGILKREDDVYSKIYLLLEYMSKRGISEEFVSELENITEFAQESLAQATGAVPTEAERCEIMKRLRTVLDRNDNQDTSDNQEVATAVMTNSNLAAETPAMTRTPAGAEAIIRTAAIAKVPAAAAV